jgi:predicted adenylyl cyclase CyaB
MLNYKDATLKARVSTTQQMIVLLDKLGAIFLGEDEQHDTYFQVTQGKLKYRKGNLGSLITHYARKMVDDMEMTQVYRYDVNPSEEVVLQLFQTHQVLGETHKKRVLYQCGNVTIHLDELPDGQTFMEAEAKDFGDIYSEKELQKQCCDLFGYLGVDQVDWIRTGYL